MKVTKTIQNNIIQESQKVVKQVADLCSKPACERAEQGLPTHNALNINHFPKFAMCQSHKAGGGLATVYPESYVKKERVFVPEYKYTKRFTKETTASGETKFVRKPVIQTVPAHFEDDATWLPHYYLDKLWTTGKSSGTNSVQALVRQSLQDPATQGRVMLDACCIDGETAPGGFYYKLGFRFVNDLTNKECAKWLAEGGKRENAPWAVGLMYLPKENISHCLNYKVK